MDRLSDWWIAVQEAYELEPVFSRIAIGMIVLATLALANWLVQF